MENNVEIEGVDTLSDPRVWIDYLAELFRPFMSFLKRLEIDKSDCVTNHNDQNNSSAQDCLAESLQLVKQLIWPVLARVFSHYGLKMRSIEHASTLVRFIVRCFSIHLKDLLPEIADKVGLDNLMNGFLSYLNSYLIFY